MRINPNISIDRLRQVHDVYVEKREAQRFAFELLQRRKQRLAEVDRQIDEYKAVTDRQANDRLISERAQAYADVEDAAQRHRVAQSNGKLPKELWVSAREYAARNLKLSDLPTELQEAIR